MYRSSIRSIIQSPTQCFSFLLATVAVWGHPYTSSGGLLVYRPACSHLNCRLCGNRHRALGTSLTMAQTISLAFAVCCKCASSSPSRGYSRVCSNAGPGPLLSPEGILRMGRRFIASNYVLRVQQSKQSWTEVKLLSIVPHYHNHIVVQQYRASNYVSSIKFQYRFPTFGM